MPTKKIQETLANAAFDYENYVFDINNSPEFTKLMVVSHSNTPTCAIANDEFYLKPIKFVKDIGVKLNSFSKTYELNRLCS